MRVASAFLRRHAVLTALLLAAGCTVRFAPLELPAAQPETPTEVILRAEIVAWQGTPYCIGGTTTDCADCSGFVKEVYRRALGIDLPRTVREMARLGRAVRTSELRAGDLVFFRTSRKDRHVGIYLRDGEFAHVSTSSGLTLSQLSGRYWSRRFRFARRIL